MNIVRILMMLSLCFGAMQAQVSRGATAESEHVNHLKEQIIRVILETDASQLASERERDSAYAEARRMLNENMRLHAQVGYMRLKSDRQDLPTPASAAALAAAIEQLWKDGTITPPSQDPGLLAENKLLSERLRQAEEARKDLSLALQTKTIVQRDEGQAQMLEASQRHIQKLEAQLSLAQTQIRNKSKKTAPGQSPAALTQRIRQLEAQNRSLRMRTDSISKTRPSAIKITTAWQVDLKRKMDSVQFENELLTQTVNDLRQVASRKFDRIEAGAQEVATMERTLAEISVREQTIRERERLLEARERELALRGERYRDLEEREVRLKMLERKLNKSN